MPVMKHNSEGVEVITELPDSICWGTPGAGSAKKVYGDIMKNPIEMAIKVERMKLLEDLALGRITRVNFELEVAKTADILEPLKPTPVKPKRSIWERIKDSWKKKEE